jgi:hypothetical protein
MGEWKKERVAGWTGRGREGDLDNCNRGEMVEVGATYYYSA